MSRGLMRVSPELIAALFHLPKGVTVLPNDNYGLYLNIIIQGPDDLIPRVAEGMRLPEVMPVLRHVEDPGQIAYRDELVKLDIQMPRVEEVTHL